MTPKTELTDDEIWRFWWARPTVPDGEDDSMEAEFVAACRQVIAADRASRAEDENPAAWLHPETLDVIHADRKEAWLTNYGPGGHSKASGYTEPLYRASRAVQQEAETEQSIAADSYWSIAETIGTLDGYSVQEHVQTMHEVLQRCSDYLHDIPESEVGGDEEAVDLAADVRHCLAGRIDRVRIQPTEVEDDQP